MTPLLAALGSPLGVALVGLLGVVLAVLTTRQKTRVDKMAAYYGSIETELTALRAAEQLNTAGRERMAAELQQAKEDILDCYRERNELALRVSALQQRVERHHTREAARDGPS